jgi:aquaporin Z
VRRLAAGLFGTFALVFTGTGAITVNAVSGGAVSRVGVALTFGLAVLAMICAVGDVSGDPAQVTVRRHDFRVERPGT